MSWIPPDDLEALRGEIAEHLADAVTQSGSGWRTPILATTGLNGGPQARTVVLRSLYHGQRQLTIYTDHRSTKVQEIQSDNRVAMTFWDPSSGQQLRITGHASLIMSGPEVDSAWENLSTASRLPYLAASTPGKPRANAGAGWSDDLIEQHLTHADTEMGRAVFTLLTVSWTTWDWLWLGRNGHRRALWRWGPAGDRQGDWVVP